MIPLYGFLQGDVIGLLVLAYEEDTISTLIEKLKSAASVRVAPRSGGDLTYKGEVLDPLMRVKDAMLEPLDRIDVGWSEVGE